MSSTRYQAIQEIPRFTLFQKVALLIVKDWALKTRMCSSHMYLVLLTFFYALAIATVDDAHTHNRKTFVQDSKNIPIP